MVAVERLRRRPVEIGVAHHRLERVSVDPPARGQRAVLVERDAPAAEEKIVDQRIGRPGVEGDDLAVVARAQVTLPTPPQLRTISGRSSPAAIAA